MGRPIRRLRSYLFDKRSCNLVLIVEGERFPVHREFLMNCNKFFSILLGGKMKEARQNEVVLKGITSRGFKRVLRFLYGDLLNKKRDKELDAETIRETLRAAHLYGFEHIVNTCRYELPDFFTKDNVCNIYLEADYYGIMGLRAECCVYVRGYPYTFLNCPEFVHFSALCIYEVIDCDSFVAEEIDIFRAVERWGAERDPEDDDVLRVVDQVRFPLMSMAQLLNAVKGSRLVPEDRFEDVVKIRQVMAPNLCWRGHSLTEGDDGDEPINVAAPEHGTLRLTRNPLGNMRDMRTGHLYISQPLHFRNRIFLNEVGFTVALKQPYFINSIKFELCPKNLSYTCSFCIDVSVNFEHWARVIDFSTYPCSLSQTLFIKRQAARYIRVSGAFREPPTPLDIPPTFKNLKAFLRAKCPKLATENYAFPMENPSQNVSRSVDGAVIVSGQNRDEGCISGQGTKSYKGAGWTWHRIRDPPIIIRLPHPYVVDSIRMFLWAYPSQGFKYIVETSLDQVVWTRVADRTETFHRSWQIVEFNPLLVLFIKIEAVDTMANKDFHVSHFECPANEKKLEHCPPPKNGYQI